MPTAALLSNATPPAVRVCAACRWSRNEAGQVWNGDNLIFCGQPDVKSDDGAPVSCSRQRFAPASAVMHQCGVSGIFWEPR
jgi:hypothetical protein